ncbi:hypothetical protein [Vibrio diabolicus]|uniref:hypothetical protein n=1 Tax=Vibrio diabolicus TaxID=50719 RepID=UPI002160F89A|nr:hypothetical protein [Vibrio diabolicus]MCS0357736.1 hypothetical protein [Vibrio diabolicus]
MIDYIESIIPITALIAISLFTLGQVVDLIKRRKEAKRKTKAIHSIVVNELERNYWSLECFWGCLRLLQDSLPNGTLVAARGEIHHVMFTQNGLETFRPLPSFKLSIIDSLLLQTAEIDEKLFNLTNEVSSTLKELESYRNQLIEVFEQTGLESVDRGVRDFSIEFLAGLVYEYDNFYNPLGKLYLEVAKKKLETTKAW